MEKEKIRKLAFLIEALENNVKILRDGMMEEIWDNQDRLISEKDIERAVASIRNDAISFLGSKKEVDGTNAFEHNMDYWDDVENTKEILGKVAEEIKKAGLNCQIDKLDNHQNFIALHISNDITTTVTATFRNSKTVQLFFDNYVSMDKGDKIGLSKEYYTIPIIDIEIIPEIIKADRPTKASEVPMLFEPYFRK